MLDVYLMSLSMPHSAVLASTVTAMWKCCGDLSWPWGQAGSFVFCSHRQCREADRAASICGRCQWPCTRNALSQHLSKPRAATAHLQTSAAHLCSLQHGRAPPSSVLSSAWFSLHFLPVMEHPFTLTEAVTALCHECLLSTFACFSAGSGRPL